MIVIKNVHQAYAAEDIARLVQQQQQPHRDVLQAALHTPSAPAADAANIGAGVILLVHTAARQAVHQMAIMRLHPVNVAIHGIPEPRSAIHQQPQLLPQQQPQQP